MTDYRSLETLHVFREGQQVAVLRRVPKGCEFRYTDDYLRSDGLPIALHLPKSKDGLRVEGIANLPTYFAGLLPEGVMFSAVRRLIRAQGDDLFAVLAATGADSVGDIETRVPGEKERRSNLTIAEAKTLINSLLSGNGDFPEIRLAAISGAQPKLSVGELIRASRHASYIAKFESPEFPNILENEFTFTRLAKLCRLNVSEIRLVPDALIINRFDRQYDRVAKHARSIHVEDMLQAMDLFPNSKYALEYVELLQAMDRLGASKATLLSALELYVFCYIIGNGDLHAKNLSLVFDEDDRQWRLSPTYDLLSTLPYRDILTEADRMALALSDDNYGRFTVSEFVECGSLFGLPPKAVEAMILRLSNLLLKHLHSAVQGSSFGQLSEVIELRAKSLFC